MLTDLFRDVMPISLSDWSYLRLHGPHCSPSLMAIRLRTMTTAIEAGELTRLRLENEQLRAQVRDLEAQADRQDQRAQRILEASLEGYHLVGADARIFDCNEAFARIVGYERHELVGMPIAEIDRRPPEELGRIIGKIIESGAMRFFAHHTHRDGHPIDVEVSVHHIRVDGDEFFAAFSHPITDQLQRERALRDSEEKFRTLFDKTSMCIGLLSPSGALLECNQAMARLIGPAATAETAAGGTGLFWEGAWWRTEDNRARIRQCIEAAAAGTQASCEVEVWDPDGKPLNLDLKIKPSQNAAGQSVLLLAEGYDVTSLRQAERERAALQAQMIHSQEATIRELSTPLIPVDAGVVVVPLIGRLDRVRASELLDKLLEGVVAQRAASVILDVTGVTLVDADVANALIRAAQAVRLLGAEAILTGIRPEMAQTLVGLGIDLTQLVTLSSLRSGLQHALRRAGR